MRHAWIIVIFSFISAGSFAQKGELWFKEGVIYNLDVKVFKDSNGDGFGDFTGLTQKLPYLDSLGIDIIWLAPFQPSPLKDDGYDVADYYGIDNRTGNFADFKTFIKQCNKQGIRIIMDLVVNHSSIEHPWFKEARSGKNSKHRNWYVWSEDKPKNINKGMAFPGVQESIWTFESSAKAYYYHRFYEFQPDLNLQNPEVKEEIKHILKFWHEAGVSGFRLDAAPFIIEVPDTKGDKFDRQHELLSEFRSYLNSLDKNAVLLGEANVPPKENHLYFGEKGEGMNMLFNFFVNQQLFYALATSETKDLKKALEDTRDIPSEANWAQFLRNHDEVDLGRLSDFKAKKVYEKFGPEKSMQLYDRGIRRRLAPMLGNDPGYLKFAYGVLFSLPNTPVVRYGDEIGMGDDLTLHERESVRTPMQWNGMENAGFSEAAKMIRPVIDTGSFAFSKVNVQVSQKDSSSLYHYIKKLIAFRGECPELQYGQYEIIDFNSSSILAIAYSYQGKRMLVVHNFHPEEQNVTLKSDKLNTQKLNEVFAGKSLVSSRNGSFDFVLKGRESQWFRY